MFWLYQYGLIPQKKRFAHQWQQLRLGHHPEEHLQLIGALIYVIVLPEEWGASFGKALRILTKGEYADDENLPAIQSVVSCHSNLFCCTSLS
jgi:hypothetical protein